MPFTLKLSVLLIAALFITCGSDDNAVDNGNNQPGANEVWMQNTAFVPQSLTVSAGTTITWTNKDNIIHTVTSGTPGNPSGLFNSGNMGANETFSFTFANAGTFNYYCQLHPSVMTATIVVQ